MNKCICNFSNNSENGFIHSNGAALAVPYYNVLHILDVVREDEFVFTVDYCPVCGRSIKRSLLQ